MDKGKKTFGKKNKTASLSQSVSKGRDVTDSGKSSTPTTAIAAIAPSAVETVDRQKDEVELKQLRQENRELQEIKRRQEAEISPLRRNEKASLMQFMQSSGGKRIFIIF